MAAKAIQRDYRQVGPEHGQQQQQQEPQLLRIDNNGAMDLAKDPKHHDRTKHIAIRHHFIREAIENKAVVLEHVRTEDNVADVLTKSLARVKHEHHMDGLGVRRRSGSPIELDPTGFCHGGRIRRREF